MDGNIVQISLYAEKIPGKGEDAEPILQVYADHAGLVSVCDGLGGAGSAVYEDAEGMAHTAAYRASRLTNAVIAEYFNEYKKAPARRSGQSLVDELKGQLTTALQEEAARIETAPSKLRSHLIKRLPTTLAALHFWEEDAAARLYQGCAIWAGDSRGYMLHSARGLQQLTEDDLKSAGDALENLINDSPLSNYINADVDFALHHRLISVPLPCVLLVATDGCFGYVPTPMHFEYLLLKNLLASASPQDWQDNLMVDLQDRAGDDISLALVALGWPSFEALKEDFQPRLTGLWQDYIDPFRRLDERLARLTQEKETCARDREELRRELWAKYKPTYVYDA